MHFGSLNLRLLSPQSTPSDPEALTDNATPVGQSTYDEPLADTATTTPFDAATAATEVELKPMDGSVAAARRSVLRDRVRAFNADDSDNTEVEHAQCCNAQVSAYACMYARLPKNRKCVIEHVKPLTRSFTTRSFTHSLNHSPTHSRTHCICLASSHLLTHSRTRSLAHSLTHSLTRLVLSQPMPQFAESLPDTTTTTPFDAATAATDVELKPMDGSVAAARRSALRDRVRAFNAHDSDNTEVEHPQCCCD